MATNSKFTADIGLKTDADLQIGGNTTIDGNATVSGNLTVNGTSLTVNATTTSVEDNMLELANQNTSSDTLDIGIYGNYDDGLSDGGATEYTGLFRDASDSTWKLFDGLEVAPTTTVNTSGAGYTLADLTVGDLTATTLTATNGLTGSSITYPTSDGTNGQVIKTDGSGTLSFTDMSSGADGITASGSNTIIQSPDDTNVIHVNNTSNVQIGTSTGSYTLAQKLIVGDGDDNDGITIQSGTTHQGNIAFNKGGGTTAEGRISYQHDSNYMSFLTNNAERMRILNNGSVGINETSPDFSGFGSNGGGLELDDVGSSFTAVKVSQGSTGNLYLAATTGAGYIWQHSNSPLVIGTNNTEHIRISESGYVGISTTSADTFLDVEGTRTVGGSGAGAIFNSTITPTNNNTASIVAIKGTINNPPSLNANSKISALRVKPTFPSSMNGAAHTAGIKIDSFDGKSATIGAGIYAEATTGADTNYAGYFSGNINVTGSVSKGSGSFRIDHPLESKTNTHHLIHSFVESPQADNIYRGKVDLVDGSATVNIDTVAGMTEGTFVVLNREVQCFTTNESNWDDVKGSVSGNILNIESQNSESTATISWLVIGERQDQHMYDTEWTDDDGKVIVEPLKSE